MRTWRISACCAADTPGNVASSSARGKKGPCGGGSGCAVAATLPVPSRMASSNLFMGVSCVLSVLATLRTDCAARVQTLWRNREECTPPVAERMRLHLWLRLFLAFALLSGAALFGFAAWQQHGFRRGFIDYLDQAAL